MVERTGYHFLPEVHTYSEDERRPIEELYLRYLEFIQAGWHGEIITQQTVVLESGEQHDFPIVAFISHPPLSEPQASLWVMAGIHGEEPGPPMAIAEEIETLIQLAKAGIPLVVIPLLNPAGYFRDWRYMNAKRDPTVGQSVTDCEELLRGIPGRNPNFASTTQSEVAKQITDWILRKHATHPPLVVFDHHEDEFEENPDYQDPQQFFSYLYYYGHPGLISLAQQTSEILIKHGMPIAEDGHTRFNEKIVHGVVEASPDGSVDELLASPFYCRDGQLNSKPRAKVVIVVETTIKYPISLPQRVSAHREIIGLYKRFWESATSSSST